MLDGVSLDQIRTFIAAVDEGSFSAAGRRLGRAQSVVSQTLANLEGQLGVQLFERGGRYPVLTAEGRALLTDARAVAGSIDLFKARARGLSSGLEPELSVVVDVMFPTMVLTCAVAAFQAEFPSTPLRILVEGLGAVIEPVLEGRCAFGIPGPVPITPPELTSEHLLGIRYQMVASPRHPLAAYPGPIPTSVLERHVQLVLSDRSRMSEGKDLGVFSSKTWRLSDLGAKHAFLLAGLGWGGMPLDIVEGDLASGALVPLAIEGMDMKFWMAMSAIYRTDSPPGPAGRWLVDRLKQTSRDEGDAIGLPDQLFNPEPETGRNGPRPAT
jgi:DNA-binding transcriptional LysR family regulator